MDVGIIGAGWVGITTGVCLANVGNKVRFYDLDDKKLTNLMNGVLPFFEPKLGQALKGCLGNISIGAEGKILDNSVVLVCVGTPSAEDGSVDLSQIDAVMDMIAEEVTETTDVSRTTIAIKSTVPPTTCEHARKRLFRKSGKMFRVCSNPEFLREGSAVDDFVNPDKIVVGFEDFIDAQRFEILYAPFAGLNEEKLFFCSVATSEMTKYANNCMLATKISLINEMAMLADKVGADIRVVAELMGKDFRISPHFLQAGSGYGGSCFPKDVRGLQHSMRMHGVGGLLLSAVNTVNGMAQRYPINLMHAALDSPPDTAAILGISFKPNTSDTRESSALVTLEALLKLGVSVDIHDPSGAAEELVTSDMKDKGDGWFPLKDMYECMRNVEVLFVHTDWDDYKELDWVKVADLMAAEGLVIDCRNMFDKGTVEAHGLRYVGIGVN